MGKANKVSRRPHTKKKPKKKQKKTSKNNKSLKKSFKTCLDDLGSSDVLLLKIYADWCIHCQNMKTEWEHLSLKTKPHVIIKELEESKDSNEISVVLRKLKYNDSFGFPTIIFVCKKNKNFIYKRYEGERTSNGFNKFIEDCKKTVK